MSLKERLIALRESAVANPEEISVESRSLAQKRQREIKQREASKKKRIEQSLLLLQQRAQWVALSTSKETWFSVIELSEYITIYTLDEAKKCVELDPVFARLAATSEEGEGTQLIPFVGYRNEKNATDQIEKVPVLFACWSDEIPPEAPTISGKVVKPL
jgi:hypothetical protein